MKDFLIQYSALRFALGRQERRRRGQHGFLASVFLLFGQLILFTMLLPIAFVQLLLRLGDDLNRAKADPTYRGTFFHGRPANQRRTDGS